MNNAETKNKHLRASHEWGEIFWMGIESTTSTFKVANYNQQASQGI